MDRSSRQKINKETKALNDTIDQIDLIDNYRTLQPKTADYTSSQVHKEHSRGYHILGHKSSFINLRKLKSYQASFLTTTL